MSHRSATSSLKRYFERSAKALNEAIPYNSAPVITIKNMTLPKPNNAA